MSELIEIKSVEDIRPNDILYDSLSFDTMTSSFSRYYHILDVGMIQDTLFFLIDNYDINLQFIGQISLQGFLIDGKKKNRIYLVKFDNISDEAKFRLQMKR